MNKLNVSTHLIVLCTGIGIGLWWSSNARNESSQKTESAQTLSANTPLAPQNRPSEANTEKMKAPTLVGNHSSENFPARQSVNPKDRFENALGDGDFETAIVSLREMERLSPDSIDVWEGSGRLWVRQRKWNEAKESLKGCLSRFPKSRSCLIDLASTEMQIGTKEEQASSVLACLAVSPKDPQCRNMDAITKMNLGRYMDAATVYESLIRDNGSYGMRFPNNILYWQYGIALEGAGRLKDASESFYKACRSEHAEACRKYEELKTKL